MNSIICGRTVVHRIIDSIHGSGCLRSTGLACRVSLALAAVERVPAGYTLHDGLHEGRSSGHSWSSAGYMSSIAHQATMGSSMALQKDTMRVENTNAKERHVFRVEATYVGSMINIYDVMSMKEYKNNFKSIHKGSALIGLYPHDGSLENMDAGTLSHGPYMAVTSYGSAVFFGTSKELKNHCLSALLQNAKVVSDPLSDHTLYTEEFTMAVDPTISTWSLLDPDCIVLQKMDLKNLQVISHVLGQSVALDFYSNHVERTLETFCSLNQEMMESANIGKLNKHVLLQLVAENNIVMTDIISKLGVHERYDIAWKFAKYGSIWDFLRTELEIETRFETLDMKLNLIQDNLKYFLEILQNKKSDSLEWIIIVLIAMEIVLSLYQIGQEYVLQ